MPTTGSLSGVGSEAITIHHSIHIVTGAPGSGKSSALQAFVCRRRRYIAFDMDWLLTPASALTGRDICTEASAWPFYNALWLEILHAVHINDRIAVLFTPVSKSDLPVKVLPSWCSGIEWLLLDCPDPVRRARLASRPEWTNAMMEEAEEDARLLRETVPQRVDTEGNAPGAVADLIVEWLDRANGLK